MKELQRSLDVTRQLIAAAERRGFLDAVEFLKIEDTALEALVKWLESENV